MTTLSLAIGASADDADESTAGTVVINGVTLGASLDNTAEYVGLRFTGLTPANGSILVRATVDVIPTATTEDEPDVTITGAKGTTASFSAGTGTFGISTQSTTAASASWSNTDLGQVAANTTRFSSSDISNVLSEIMGDVAYDDTAIIIFRGSSTNTRDLTFKSFNASASDAATLTVEFVPVRTMRMNMMGAG